MSTAAAAPQAESYGQEETVQLFEKLEQAFASTEALGAERWYLLAIATLAGSPDPELAEKLYTHIISKPQFTSSEARQRLVRRLREALVKSICIVGVCKPIEAILAIAKAERPEDRDFTSTRETWESGPQNHENGMEWLRKIYTGNTNSTLDLFNAHKDFRWISSEITYGLYLSDRQVLDDFDTELVVLSGIMIQNLKLETLWHIRGARRLGISKQDVQTVYNCVHLVAQFFGLRLNKVPTVEEVEKEV